MLIVLGLLLATPASAEIRSEPHRVMICEYRDKIAEVIPVCAEQMTTLYFPERVRETAFGRAADYSHSYTEQGKHLHIQPVPFASDSNVNLTTVSKRISLGLDVTDPAEAVYSVYFIEPATPSDQPGACVRAGQPGEPLARLLLTAKRDEQEVLDPVSAHFESGIHKFSLETGSISVGSLGMVFHYEVRNDGDAAIQPVALAVGDGRTARDYLVLSLPDTDSGVLPDELRPGQTLKGEVLAKDANRLRRGFVLELRSRTVDQPVEFRITPRDRDDPIQNVIAFKQDELKVLPGVVLHYQEDGYDLELRTGPLSVGRTYFSFNHCLKNRDSLDLGRSFSIAGAKLLDRAGTEDHLVSGADKLPSEIGPGEKICGTIIARKPDILAHGWVFMLDGIVPAAFNWKEDPPPPPPPPRNLRKLAVGLRGIVGAVQLNDTTGATDWTINQGFGVRVAYTPLTWLSAEGTAEYLQTGDAELGGATAHLTGGRFQAGVLAHFGEQVIPFLRVGAGLVGGSQTTADDSEFRLEGFFALGAGVDVWLGKRLIIGASATGRVGEFTSIEAGAHLAIPLKI